ncbi:MULTISPECIES: 2'-5' RNA ligase family protein [unclassified Streptomyces]|uniref:2'-5' RNA ligase family protein n=1 Tax=unclassified Streptomyces TaxID=2593676 RepID=UPI00344F49F2
MHTVELLPDGATERAVGEVWCRLLEAGLPSQAAHRHPTNRPHLTLATVDGLEADVRRRLEQVLTVLPLPLRLGGTLRFGGRTQVLAWAVLPDEELLRLHERVWRALRDAPSCGRLNPVHAPERWTPHISLGRGRHAVWPLPDTALLPGTPGGTGGGLTGRWVSARTYDSVPRTTDRLG